jgi:hypothetical protein
MTRFLISAAFVALLLTPLAATDPRARFAGSVRLFCIVAIMVTIVLRRSSRARQASSGKCTVRCSALFVRSAWPMAAI